MATTKKSGAKEVKYEGFTEEERAAMKERGKELKTAARRSSRGKKAEEPEVLEKIAEMADLDRAMAERVHALIKDNAPDLAPTLWYGMPAYAKDGKVVCFFQPAQKFKSRYATLSFNDDANLDDGSMWPTSFALTKLTAADEKKSAAPVQKAAG